MTKPTLLIAAMLAAAPLLAQASLAAPAKPVAAAPAGLDRGQVEEIVRTYLLDHPEVLAQALAKLEEVELQRRVTALRPHLEKPFAGAWSGNPDGDVVVVEFFDYACGYCRKTVPEMQKLLAADPGVKVIYREFPILGPGSLEAARASLVAAQAGRYAAYQNALFGAPGLDRKALLAGIAAAEVKLPKDYTEIDAELGRNRDLAKAIGISGTPAFIVGGQFVAGAVDFARLQELVAAARERARAEQAAAASPPAEPAPGAPAAQ